MKQPTPETGTPVHRVTMRDIARAAGVHATTVSMALRDSPRLKATTRKKIQKIAKKLGYRSDPVLSALNAYRISQQNPAFHATIAWFNNWPNRESLLKHPTRRAFYEGASSQADQLGYRLEEFWLHEEGMTAPRLTRILAARNISAILLPPQPNPALETGFDYWNYSVIGFDFSATPSMVHLICNDDLHAIKTTISNLHELGYRRIGFCYSKNVDEKLDHAILEGVLYSYWKYPDLIPLPFCENHWDRKSLADWMKTEKPDVVVGHLGIEKELAAIGFSIPKEVGFSCLELFPDSVNLSGILMDNFFIGQQAVNLLVGKIQRGERGETSRVIHTFVQGKWISGKSLAKDI